MFCRYLTIEEPPMAKNKVNEAVEPGLFLKLSFLKYIAVVSEYQ
jgi:hypothetical protein